MRKVVKSKKAPQPRGPYSPAIIANGFVFCSGQIPIDPATGELNTGSIEDQTRQVLKNVSAVLEAAGSSLDEAVKVTVFLQDMNDFAKMNAVYGEFFKAPNPARAAVQVARLPRDGYTVEKVIFESQPRHYVTAIFYRPDGPPPFPGVGEGVEERGHGDAERPAPGRGVPASPALAPRAIWVRRTGASTFCCAACANSRSCASTKAVRTGRPR